MFANVAESEHLSPWDELFAYYADSPLADSWRPHATNPIVSDVRRARPAGAVFRAGSRLVRPSQDSGGHYGAGLNFCEIESLSHDTYSERVLGRLSPGGRGGLFSMHTFNASAGWQVTDFQRLGFATPLTTRFRQPP